METVNWISQIPDGLILKLYIQPGAKKTESAGMFDGALKVRLAAPPVDGKANKALLAWLAQTLGVAKQSVKLISGEKSRHKQVKILQTISLDEVLKKLR